MHRISTAFIIIFLLNLFFFIGFDSSAMLFVDTSRELYIPWQMNEGQVLYKDIFNVYAPLAYQVNAFFTHIFPGSIHTFFWLGFINSTFILWGLYLVMRFVVKGANYYKLAVIYLIMVTCVYSVSYTNYIFPYSYSMVYALNAFIWSLVCALYFVKKDKNKFLYLAFLFYGLSISFKYEFIPFILVLSGICVYKKVNLKTAVLCVLFMFFVPFLSLLDLVLKGVSLNDFYSAFKNMVLLSKSKSVNTLYSFLGFIPSFESLKFLALNFVKLICFVPLFVFTYPSFVESNAFYFSWIGVLVLIMIPICAKKNKYLFIILISTVICSLKCIFNISFNSYGTYYFPLLLICCIPKHSVKPAVIVVLITAVLYTFSNYERAQLVFSQEKYDFYKGSIKPVKQEVIPVLDTIRYIKNNSDPDDTVLVLPEGAMINFFSGRKSHNKFYYLIPPNIEIFGEDNIVKELEKDLPEYLVIQPMSYTNFGETHFCESFGNKICDIIPKYYEKPVVFGQDFWLAVYKKKDLNYDSKN